MGFATTLHDGWGDHRYFVFNPDTGALLHSAPEAAIASGRRTYASKRARIQGTATGTGVAGGYLEKGFLGLAAALFLIGGIAAEPGAYAFVAEEVAPVVSRIAVQAEQPHYVGGAINLGPLLAFRCPCNRT